MKSYLFTILIVGISLGNVDILIPESGQVPVVGWTDDSTPWLMYCQEPSQPVGVGNSCGSLFLSMHTESDSEPVLLVTSGNQDWNISTHFNAFSLPGLSLTGSRELDSSELIPPEYCAWYALPVLPRYAVCGEDRTMFIVMNTGYTDGSVQDQTWMTMVPVNPWSTTLVNPADTSSWQLGDFATASCLSALIPHGSLPMFCVGSDHWYPPMGPAYFGITSMYTEADTLKRGELFGYFGNTPSVLPKVLASGYSQTEQIALWSDTVGAVWCSNFVSSPASPENSLFEVAHSETPFAAAMTRTREDEGILLAWYDGANIMVRHWLGEWNGYAHVVESWAHVSPGNIAVCSDTDGYWVAWKDDLETVPQYRFIPRNVVTGIEGDHSGLLDAVFLTVSENPVNGTAACSVSLLPGERYSLCLFDLYGRNLGELASGNGGRAEVPLDLSDYPAGIYNVVLTTESGVSSIRVLKTGN